MAMPIFSGVDETGSLEKMVLKYGDDRMHKMYLAVCQELLEEKA